MERKRMEKPKAEGAIPISSLEQRKRLEKELSEKRQALAELQSMSPKDYQDLKQQGEGAEKLLFDIGRLENQIEALTLDVQSQDLEKMAERRKAILERAEALATEKENLLARLSQINDEGLKLLNEFELNTPKKRVQTESSQLLKWERNVTEQRIVGLTLKGGDAIFGPQTHREETVSDGMPYRIRELEAAGWHLVPGQEAIKDEPLTPANSREMLTIGMPEIFQSFLIEFVK